MAHLRRTFISIICVLDIYDLHFIKDPERVTATLTIYGINIKARCASVPRRPITRKLGSRPLHCLGYVKVAKLLYSS